MLHVSIVSHAQGEYVRRLLTSLARLVSDAELFVTITQNVPEEVEFCRERLPFGIDILHNPQPLGFAANHNNAFKSGSHLAREYFCVLNPDVVITTNIFRPLCQRLFRHPQIGVIGPLVFNSAGELEDSMRSFPTPLSLLHRALQGRKTETWKLHEGLYHPDWIAGMCMIYRTQIFASVGGFDERYFLYYEDVDLCCRLRLAGYQVVVDPLSSIVHDAQRASHRDLGHLRHHLASIWRFFSSPVFRPCLRLRTFSG
jgi:hypothetical protein